MKEIKEFADCWKEFKARQKRIYERNLHSDEYHEAITIINSWPRRRYCMTPPFYLRDVALEKDMYSETIEGMLEWINDGKKD